MKLTRIAVAGLAVVAFAGLAFAGGAEGHAKGEIVPDMKQGLATGITALVVFILTAAFLQLVVWPKINGGLKDREDKIRNAIDEAEMAQEQAKAALEQYERNLAQARAEAQKMLDDAKTQQQVIAAELKAKSEIELGQLRDKARRDIEAAKAQAVVEIHAHATALATAMAGKILKREVNAGDQQRLISESLQELQTAGRA